MKRIIAIALLSLSSLIANTQVWAQQHALKATVPFEFSVGGKTLPADTYTITVVNGLVTFQSDDSHARTTIYALPGHNESTGGSKLVFNRYGDRRFLHDILCPTTLAMNVSIATSKEEKRVRSREINHDQGEVAVLMTR